MNPFQEKILARDGLCVVCRRYPEVGHHIRTRGAGGDDSYENGVSLCTKDHNRVHAGRIGLYRLDSYWIVTEYQAGQEQIIRVYQRCGPLFPWRDCEWQARSRDQVVLRDGLATKTICLGDCSST